jgi:hypothetical protein
MGGGSAAASAALALRFWPLLLAPVLVCAVAGTVWLLVLSVT